MKHVASVVALFFICAQPASSECLLDEGTYMPFVCRIATTPAPSRTKRVLTTCNILTPRHVLTTCRPYQDFPQWRDPPPKNVPLVVELTRVYYRVVRKDKKINTFQVSDGLPNSENCLLSRPVENFYGHPECSKFHLTPAKERYNIGVLRLQIDLLNAIMGERVPVLPFMSSIRMFMSTVNWFNALRKSRCQIPCYNLNSKSVPFFYSDNAYSTVPFYSKCAKAWCLATANETRESTDVCMMKMKAYPGTLLCVRHVKQKTIEMDYWDEKSEDKLTPHNDAVCKKTSYMMGAPLVCGGMVTGFVTGCTRAGYMITTVVGLRHYILTVLVTPGLTPSHMDEAL